MPDILVGTTPRTLAVLTEQQKQNGYVIDFCLQNLSANDVFIGGQDVSTTSFDVKVIATTGSFSNDRRQKDLVVVASGADSEVCYDLEIHPHDMKRKVYFNYPVMKQ